VQRVKSCILAAFLKVASIRRLDASPKIRGLAEVYADEISRAADRDWRLQDLLVPCPCDANLAMTAAKILRPLWVEVRDHATHRFQAICPAMALAAIHKTWEYGVWSGGGHFADGSPRTFGFDDVEEILVRILDIPDLPAQLSQSLPSVSRRHNLGIGLCRTLPKDADPADSHRALCDRSRYPTSQLDSILCRAGVWALRFLDSSEHLDISDPRDAMLAFNALSDAVDWTGATLVVDDNYDMKKCFTNVPQAEIASAVHYVVSESALLEIESVFVPKRRRSCLPVLRGGAVRASMRFKYIEVPLQFLPGYSSHHCSNCYSWFGGELQKQIDGLPMGSAFSVFLQRCWAVFRELFFSRTLDTHTLRMPGYRIARLLCSNCWVLVLEMRYADDLSQTALAPHDSDITPNFLREILRGRRELRYQQIDGHGVELVAGADGMFVGLRKFLVSHGIIVRPSTAASLPVDVLPELISDMTPSTMLQHYNGWYPPALPYALLSGMAARATLLASNSCLADVSLTESLSLFFTSADYPFAVVHKLAKKWDDAHPGALLSCASAVEKAYKRSLFV
jgi:hypothetical protein